MSKSSTKRPRIPSLADAYGARIGVALLVLTGLSLLGSTITQRLWTWDRYLHGGHDFETGVLVILVSLSLVLLLMHHCKHAIDDLAAASPSSSRITDAHSGAHGRRRWLAAQSHDVGGPPLIQRNYDFPLTI